MSVGVHWHDGPVIASEQDALDVLAATYGSAAEVLAIPVERLSPDFFRLRSGLAGAILQKWRNYGFRVAIVGDIGRWTAGSRALGDFVRESNRGGQVLFVADAAELAARLGAPASR